MKVLNKKFPGCFLTGTVPSTCYSPKTDRKGKLKAAPVVTANENMEWFTPECIFFLVFTQMFFNKIFHKFEF